MTPILALLLLAVAKPAGYSLDFRLSAFHELYFAARSGDTGLPESVRNAGLAVSPDGRGLFSGMAVDGVASNATSPEDFHKRCDSLPETLTIAGRELKPREAAKNLANALITLSPKDRQMPYEAAIQSLTEAKERLERTFKEHPDLLEFTRASLGIGKNLDAKVPVILVSQMPLPGAATYENGPKKGICVVSVSADQGNLFIETVLHESIHALLEASKGKPSHLATLEEAFKKAGKAGTRAASEAEHAIIFAQAAASLRKVFDPRHKGYVVERGLLSRLSATGKKAFEVWGQVIEGKLKVEEAISGIVSAG
ncbi:MAG: hypothetical protein HZC36_09500 [Armatimonadetes bacterium]|nr:hypothetical protein [Armatimonadota bacterium]